MYDVPPLLLWSIAKNESGLDPYAVNVNKNGTYDYGLMQINSFWEDLIGEESWNALRNPCHNVKVGAWILALCIEEFGYRWKAVGCYHSRNGDLQAAYVRKIQRIIEAAGNISVRERRR